MVTPSVSAPLVRVPTVEGVAASSEVAKGLPPEVMAQLAEKCLLTLAALVAQVPLMLAAPHGPMEPSPDELLTPAQAAERLHISRDWLYDHARRLPFAVKLGPKQLRFSRAGLEQWLRRRQLGKRDDHQAAPRLSPRRFSAPPRRGPLP
jgi:excisionase family DNA binding protein